MHAMERINRRTWSDPLVLRDYQRGDDGYLNAGERAALDLAAAGSSELRVLDIGVGAGRTANLFRGRAASYLGVDYTPQMVDLSRAAHPDLAFAEMDARDLGALETGAFDLVFFSYNGIDSVDPAGRAAAFASAARVLAPGGAFVFSTFNRDWQGFTRRIDYRRFQFTANPVRLGLRLGLYVTRSAIGLWRKHRNAAFEHRGDHTIVLHGAHDFGILVYATTPDQARRQLADAGFAQDCQFLDIDGKPLEVGATAKDEYFYVIARKPKI